MNKAFIFDMDGVIIDSERTWSGYNQKLFGKDIAKKITIPVGMSLPGIYDLVTQYGYDKGREVFYDQYHKRAITIYQEATITKDFEVLMTKLVAMGFKI